MSDELVKPYAGLSMTEAEAGVLVTDPEEATNPLEGYEYVWKKTADAELNDLKRKMERMERWMIAADTVIACLIASVIALYLS